MLQWQCTFLCQSVHSLLERILSVWRRWDWWELWALKMSSISYNYICLSLYILRCLALICHLIEHSITITESHMAPYTTRTDAKCLPLIFSLVLQLIQLVGLLHKHHIIVIDQFAIQCDYRLAKCVISIYTRTAGVIRTIKCSESPNTISSRTLCTVNNFLKFIVQHCSLNFVRLSSRYAMKIILLQLPHSFGSMKIENTF